MIFSRPRRLRKPYREPPLRNRSHPYTDQRAAWHFPATKRRSSSPIISADSLTVIDTKTLKVVRHIPHGGPEPDAVRPGEILFNSGKMTFHGQFALPSCHPNGGSDGLTWDLTRDGIGNFKKTKSLLGVKDTAPYGWEGSSPTLEDRIAGTLRTLHQHEPEGTEVEDIAAYLRSLPPPRPLPVDKEDQPAVARGEKLFKGKAQCAKCHQPPTFQDASYTTSARGPTDTTARFDTSLRGLARDRDVP